MKLAEIHTLYETNCRSIADMLRQAATSIEAEPDQDDCSPTKAIVAVQLSEDGQVEIYGWGDTDDLHAIGLLERGKHRLLGMLARATEPE
jgi:hypothetical protein